MNANPDTPNLYARTIADIKSKYSQDDFNKIGENEELHYQVLSPLFSNLHGKKILHCERLALSLAEIKEIEVTEEHFTAQIERIRLINDGRTRKEETIAKKIHWTFGGRWDFLCSNFEEACFYAPYAGWHIWVEPLDIAVQIASTLAENDIPNDSQISTIAMEFGIETDDLKTMFFDISATKGDK